MVLGGTHGSDLAAGAGSLMILPVGREAVRRKLALSGRLEFRPLLVLRDAVDAIWPVASRTVADVETGGTGSDNTAGNQATSAEATDTGGRPSNKELVYETLSQTRTKEFPWPSLKKRWHMNGAERERRLGPKSWSERIVIAHVVSGRKMNGSQSGWQHKAAKIDFRHAKTDFRENCQIEFLRAAQ